MASGGTHDRFASLGRGHNIPADAPLTYFSMPSPWLNTGDRTQIDELHSRLIDLQATLLIIDNLGTTSGTVDENSAEMVKILGNLRWLAETTGTAIIVIHHRRKSTGSNGSRAGDALRGHSSIEAALDLALYVERDGSSKTISIQATKVRGADVAPFSAVFAYENDQAGQLSKARFFSAAPPELIVIANINQAIYDCLGDENSG